MQDSLARATIGLPLLRLATACLAGAQSVTFAGLSHTADGAAQIALQPAGLTVSNIGSTGLGAALRSIR